ncbi:aminotransferase-like domain-containing protein [Periweissella beninensis]|uniref:aminotransferase-like domain-containing protein n=1 Tax=Periweissella beninensis TaxID=504936 RepID=UPI0021A8873E|nr:PLP-dependent aminotransferase family protein [Periweissella beninensis]
MNTSPINNQFANRIANSDPSGLADLFMASSDPKNISFAGGYPDTSLFPETDLATSFSQAIANQHQAIFQYTDAKGPLKLREQLITRHNFNNNGQFDPANILVTQGGQQAIDLISRLFLNTQTGLALEAPTYMGAIAAFQAYEPTFYEIPMEEDGLNLTIFENELKKGQATSHKIKLLYTIPDFQNPTGITMSTPKRQRLAQLAKEYDFYIIEDSPYRELRYHGEPQPTIQSFDTDDRVLFVSSFSKILSPGLRIGYVVGSSKLITQLAGLKAAVDVQSPTLTLEALSYYLEHFNLDAHINQLKVRYQAKLAAMLTALTIHMPSNLKFTKPSGGFFIWLEHQDAFDMNDFMQQICLPQAHIVFVPSNGQYPVSNVTNGARLNFSNVSILQIQLGIEKLAHLLTTEN